MSSLPIIGSVWRHKSGGTYIVRGHCLIEATLKLGVVYESRRGFVLDGVEWTIWCRPADEFMDGRFEQICETAKPIHEPRPDPVAALRDKIKAQIEVQKSVLRTWYPDETSRDMNLRRRGCIDGLECALALMAEPGEDAGGGT